MRPDLVLTMVPGVVTTLTSVVGECDVTSDMYPGDEIMFNMLLLADLLLVPGIY